MATWVPDYLGTGFEQTTFELVGDQGDDAQEASTPSEELVATLVRSLPVRRSLWQKLTRQTRDFEEIDVLYVHGWSDYFFQKEFASFWTSRGARFFALDLRRYGRSLRENQVAGFATDLEEYDAEIDLAVAEIQSDQKPGKPPRKFVLVGHSTGGLVLSLWAARHPGIADALVLNSPWLEFQLAARARQLLTPIVRLGARYTPLDSTPLLDHGFYSRAQAEVGPRSELEAVNFDWRPEQVRTVHSGWLAAVLEGHELVHRGLGLEIPICVMLSARSVFPTKWSDELTRADSVLDVDEVAKAALRLGESVTIERIDGALHDIFLSAESPRQQAYERLERWMIGWKEATARSER
ncbi:alpha/beta hydrolase [Leucobacter denitrificans]|uniref:Alpha/beta hydrolase n=1 Tax=Leucobacter denitrificans TaxID=683042 RepID=A0A7G9S2U6_9MICO|nr:alpha/beta hydrolase [Leucobacter denitrificans]QNN62171.1 alpha/beta hydrolase [Leucobacter denitrificans]